MYTLPMVISTDHFIEGKEHNNSKQVHKIIETMDLYRINIPEILH